MSILSDNLKYLRSKKGISQNEIGNLMMITRERYATYERAASEPPLEIMQKFAHYYKVSIDLMISVDLRKVPMEELLKLDGYRLLLPITVDHQGEDFIEIIPYKAKAGYLNSYSDPEYIESLQRISLPFLSKGKYRAFPVEGDSMPPHKDGGLIIGKFVENLKLKKGKSYVVLTRNEGIVYKRVAEIRAVTIVLASDNLFYEPYEIAKAEILEVWQYAASMTTNEYEPSEFAPDNITNMFVKLTKDVREIKNIVSR